MKFCQDHWDALRKAIEDRGLGDLIAPDGQVAGEQIVDQFERAGRGEEITTAVNYDPLMSAFWAITNNSMNVARNAGGTGSALYLMSGGPEEPVEGFKGYENRTWPLCPICYLNLAHEMTCDSPSCELDHERGYDWFIDRAADDQVEYAEKLRSEAPND